MQADGKRAGWLWAAEAVMRTFRPAFSESGAATGLLTQLYPTILCARRADWGVRPVSFFRDYFLPHGKRVEFWGEYNRALIPLFIAIAPFLVLDLAFGTRTMPSPAFWLSFGAGAMISVYVFSIGVGPSVRRIMGKNKKGRRKG